jgi:hypothetical protein
MKSRTLALYLLVTTCLVALVSLFPVQAAGDASVNVLYQNSFATDPHWTTLCPTYYYWDPGLETYHFAIEPSTGCYAYTTIDNYDKGPFTLEYDVILTSIDDGATFRLGFSGKEMNPSKGPNVLTEFTNAKFGQIVWLHLVTPGNKMVEVNSQSGDSLSSGPLAYDGPTKKYDLNKTYHVTVNYNGDQKILSMKVNEKMSGNELWGYFVNTGEDLHGMNRIYLGSIGDYGMMNIYAKGYIDNIRLTVPAPVTTTPAMTVTAATTSQVPVATAASRPAATLPTPYPTTTTTPESPLSGISAAAALGVTCVCYGLFLKRRD